VIDSCRESTANEYARQWGPPTSHDGDGNEVDLIADEYITETLCDMLMAYSIDLLFALIVNKLHRYRDVYYCLKNDRERRSGPVFF